MQRPLSHFPEVYINSFWGRFDLQCSWQFRLWSILFKYVTFFLFLLFYFTEGSFHKATPLKEAQSALEKSSILIFPTQLWGRLRNIQGFFQLQRNGENPDFKVMQPGSGKYQKGICLLGLQYSTPISKYATTFSSV